MPAVFVIANYIYRIDDENRNSFTREDFNNPRSNAVRLVAEIQVEVMDTIRFRYVGGRIITDRRRIVSIDCIIDWKEKYKISKFSFNSSVALYELELLASQKVLCAPQFWMNPSWWISKIWSIFYMKLYIISPTHRFAKISWASVTVVRDAVTQTWTDINVDDSELEFE